MLELFRNSNIIPVIAPIGVGEDGETYNINADTVAGAVAAAMKAKRFLLLTDVPGVLDRQQRLIHQLTIEEAEGLIADGTISGGMIPKVATCLEAVIGGVEAAVIIDGRVAHAILLGTLRRGRRHAHPPRGGVGPRMDKPARGYPDLHDHLAALDKAGLLVTVDRAIDKDSEMHPLVRWQFRGGIEEADRKAFLFRNVVDAKGRHYDIPVVVGAIAASREIYRIGMGCALDRIDETWKRAMAHPIAPRVVTQAPCHEIVLMGEEADLGALPIPISTPGWDVAPYTTLSQYITRDPDTGVQNMGIYRGQVKAPRRLGMNPSLELRPGIYVHWEKARARGQKLPAAVVLGAPPAVCLHRGAEAARDDGGTGRRRRARGVPHQCRARQDRRSPGAGRGRDRDRGSDRHRMARARGAVRRIARPRQSPGIQRLHGGDLHHPAARRDPDLDHLAGDADRNRA